MSPARNPAWHRDELILALDLYFRHNPVRINQNHPEVRALSKILNALPIHADRPDVARFRSPNGVYSDTILFWAPADGQIEILPGMLSILMKQVIGSMPLRAGIAFGDCVIDPEKHVYLGQPIIDAYRTEQAQEWVGGAYHPSCLQATGFR